GRPDRPAPAPDGADGRANGANAPQFAPARTNIRFMFHAMVTRFHSPRTLSRPRSRNWRNPSTDLMMPNTGSGVCLRKAWSARPSGVFSLWAIAWTGVGCSGAAGVGAKRTLSLYPRTAGDRHGFPLRFDLARHLDAGCMGNLLCKGLVLRFR